MRAGIRSRPWAGLDVGTFSVKLLAMVGGGPSPRMQAAEVPLAAPGAEPDRDPTPEVIARAIQDAMELLELSPRSFRGVTMGISGADVIVKQISLPLLDDAEVGPALRFEARKHLPFDPQGMVIDFQILGRYLSEKRLDVLLAAVSQEHLDRHVAPLALLDLEADIVDATPLALTNAIADQASTGNQPLLLLDVGYASSHLTLYQRGEPYFSRRLEFGGRSLTRAIAEGTNVPYEEAEQWKLALGAERPGVQVDWKSPEMLAMLESIEAELVEELRRSFAFYRTLGQLPDHMRLLLSGGSACLPGIADRLTERLGTPVALFDPLSDGNGRAVTGPQFAQAYGLALRSA
jgi:type IV pilus assembly protein PilM